MSAIKPIPDISEAEASRFWSKVDKRAKDECWPWLAGTFVTSKGPNGSPWKVGCFAIKRGNWISLYAPRVAYRLAYGTDPGELLVCHTCDNPICCNPSHFFLGTHADNATDKVKKGRCPAGETHGSKSKPGCMPKGEDNKASKLKEEQVLRIREACVAPVRFGTYASIAKEYGVTHRVITQIVRRKTWRHI